MSQPPQHSDTCQRQPPFQYWLPPVLLARPCHDRLDALRRRLGKAAQAGDVKAAEAVLAELEAAGLPPGQRAFHGLVFAYTKARPHNTPDVMTCISMECCITA